MSVRRRVHSKFVWGDAPASWPRFEVPFFLFQGESDVITLTSLAEEYFEEIKAPKKQLALIKNAGHFAAFTEPEQFLDQLLTHGGTLITIG